MIRRALAAAFVLAALGGTTAAHAQTTDTVGSSTLTLASQTSWVDPQHNVFALRVVVGTPVATDQVQVIVDVFARLTTRSDFTRTLSSKYSGYEIAQPINNTLASLHPDAHGVFEVDIPVTNLTSSARNLLRLSTSGVYPVAVDLRPKAGGKSLARLVTTMLYTSAPIKGPPLQVAWVVPVHSPPGTAQPAVDALVNAIGAHPELGLTFKITPDTLSLLDPTVVSRLARLVLPNREVLTTTWVPMSLPAMLGAGLGDQASLSLARGTDRLTTALGTQAADRTWVEDGPVNEESLTFLRGEQFDRVVLPEQDLDTNPLRFTLAQPFVVAGANHTTIRAAVADAGLQSHFFNGGDQVLAAHQLLGDLFQIYGDAPANTRGVVLVTPRDWTPTAAFLDIWLSGLSTSPVLATTTVDTFFDAIPPIVGRDADPLTRQVVTDQAVVRADSASLMADAQRVARGQLDALATALPDDRTVYPGLERLLLEVPSEDLDAPRRRSLLDSLNSAIGTATKQIVVGGPKTITLTARTGRMPLNLVSQFDQPVRVLLRVEGDKLELPNVPGSGSGRWTFQEELHKGNNPLDLSVRARTPGAFTVKLTVLTPGGNLVMTQTRLTVQSTALSGVGVVLSAGAALFLVLWWGRHAWQAGRGRHARHAKPT